MLSVRRELNGGSNISEETNSNTATENSRLRSIDGELLINARSDHGVFTYAAQSIDGAIALVGPMRAAGFFCDIRVWRDARTGYELTKL